jgi:hypothetical protein
MAHERTMNIKKGIVKRFFYLRLNGVVCAIAAALGCIRAGRMGSRGFRTGCRKEWWGRPHR